MELPDKYAVGSVTLVDLLGLTASPRIPSASSDGAVLAADSTPPQPSAAAGMGQQAADAASDPVPHYFALQSAPPSALQPSGVTAHISAGPGSPVPPQHGVPDSGEASDAQSNKAAVSPDLAYVFDGQTSFGDDEILDFELAASDPILVQSDGLSTILLGGEVDNLLGAAPDSLGDWGMYDIIDCSGSHSPEPQRGGFTQFVAPDHIVSTNDAVPPI